MIEVINFYQYDIIRNIVAKFNIPVDSFYAVQFESVKSKLYFKSIYSKTVKGLKRIRTDLSNVDYEMITDEGWTRIKDNDITSCYENVQDKVYSIKKIDYKTKKLLNKYYEIDNTDIANKCRKLIPNTELDRLEQFIKLKGKQKYFSIKHNGNFGYWIKSDLYYKKVVK